MLDNSLFDAICQDNILDVLNPNKTKPITPLKPIEPLDICFTLETRPLAIEVSLALEKQHPGHKFIVQACDDGWQVINYNKLSPGARAWADEVRGYEEYYV